MDSQTAYDRIVACGLIAGMRGPFTGEYALAVTETLLKTGINMFEFTMNSPDAVETMQAVKRAHGDDALVGMGTVLTVEQAQRVLDAGADMVIAPSFQRAVVQTVHAAGTLMIPGVITPTEAVDAWAMGAKLLKIFPIGTLGIDYFRTIRGPLDHIAFMCNGGMTDENVGAFMRAGAAACGMANWLTGDGTMALDVIARRGAALRAIVDEVRGGERVRA